MQSSAWLRRRADRLEIHRHGWSGALAALHPAVCFALIAVAPFVPVLLRLCCATLAITFGALAVWRRIGREVITTERGQLILRRRLLGITFHKIAVSVADVSHVVLRGEQAKAAARSAIAPARGPCEIVTTDGKSVRVAFDLGLSREELVAVRDQLISLLGR